MGKSRNKAVVVRRMIQSFLLITIGALLMAAGLELFLIPNKIIDGGIVGISIILSEITKVKLGILLLVLNLPFLYIGYKQIGKTFAFSTLYAVAMMSLFTSLLHHTPVFTTDSLLATVFGGIILGAGVGIVIRNGGSLDGTEIMAILLNSKTPFSVGQIVMFCNVFILGSAGFVFGWDKAMYSLLAYYIAFKMIDIVVEGLDESKVLWIISDKSKEIATELMSNLGRGVTYLNGEGAYSGEEKKVIFLIINRLEEAKVKSLIDDIDEDAFLAVGHINDVKGAHYKKKGLH
ncbi:YitT family protein [Priestia filamentosa]|uniref:YitT family protein n=1 Tax=Priestia filamentosa TaxID=1402861 RepID=UPI000589295B